MKSIVTKNKYIEKVRQLILDSLRNEPIKVILYGSRARGDNSVGSDVDIGLLSKGSIDRLLLSNLREMLEDSTIPYKVEIIDLSQVSDSFKNEIMKDAIIWKDWN